jgi:hypothetical protein
VIDSDLGLPGRSVTYREGFKELVARVYMGGRGGVRRICRRPALAAERLGPRPLDFVPQSQLALQYKVQEEPS